MADGRLVVANGGIQTGPGDRTKLNIRDMRPNLTLFSAEGALLDQVALDASLHQNSVRHLALTASGVAFAMQWEGDPALAVPQLGLWNPGTPPRLCLPADKDAFAMQGYAGSIAISVAGDQIGLTSAPAGAMMLFDAEGRPLATHQRADISGLAASDAGLIATDGQGGVWQVGVDVHHDRQADNRGACLEVAKRAGSAHRPKLPGHHLSLKGSFSDKNCL
jgi:hypothetical protein